MIKEFEEESGRVKSFEATNIPPHLLILINTDNGTRQFP